MNDLSTTLGLTIILGFAYIGYYALFEILDWITGLKSAHTPMKHLHSRSLRQAGVWSTRHAHHHGN